MSACTCSLPLSTPSPLARFASFKRFQAWGLAKGSASFERRVHATKAALFGRLQGTVLEIGPGAGANLPFLRRDVHWIGVEPNPFAHAYLEARATEFGLNATLHQGVAERLPVPDASVDAVVCSLVLCSVADLHAALGEIRRVLKPGGRFVFVEHVAAPRGTWLRRAQRAMRAPQRVLADGCRPDQETWAAIEQAGFASVIFCHDRITVRFAPLLMGMAVR